MAGQCEAQQLAYLRRQIEMRSIGLGWVQYSTNYSSQSDRKIGTVAHLQQLLVGDILPEEMALRRLKQLPVEAAPPHHEAQDLGQLGSADEDAMEIASTVRSSKLSKYICTATATHYSLPTTTPYHYSPAGSLLSRAAGRAVRCRNAAACC
jgi:hypothetical protein